MTIVRDLRYAIRCLSRAWGFSALVVVTLGLGIGANTAVFSALRGVLLRPLPHRSGGELVYLRQSAELAGEDNVRFSVPEVIDYRTGATLLTGFAEFSAMTFNMLGHTEPVQVAVGIVTGNYFEVLGLRTVVGRAFDAREDGPAAEPVMVLTHEYWMRMFGGTPDVVGRAVRINGRTLTIVGVLQPAPHYPQRTDVFVNMVTSPHHLSATMVQGRTHRMTEVFARLTAGTSVTQANVELAGIASRVHTDHPDAYETAAGYQVVATPLRDVMTGEARLTLQLLMATTVLVLLIALVNVTNLMLMRLVGREQELAVRWSLGASAWGLRRLLLMESGVLALAGAGLGLAIAWPGVGLLVRLAERLTPRAAEIRGDGVVLVFTIAVALAVAGALAFAPSFRRLRRLGSSPALKDARATSGGSRRRSALALGAGRLAARAS
jgi:predicted permease